MRLLTFKIFAFIFITSAFISCNKTKKSEPLTLFTFDKVEHYSTGIKDSIITSINKKKFHNLNEIEESYLKFIHENIPTNIKDTSFVSTIEKLKFKKKIVPDSEIKILKEIFSEAFCNEMAESACIPMYRDIYVFKKNNQITGIAKVCFECKIIYFISDDYSWQRFGECENLEKLQKI